MEFDRETRLNMWRLAQDEKTAGVRRAVADAMNETSTNPNAQAQYLATQAARAGFEEGIVAAKAVFAMMREFTNDVKELGKPFLDELDNFLEGEPSE